MAEESERQHSMVLSLLLAVARHSIIVISVVMVLVTLAQVVFRYVLSAPLPWSEELARYCFVWIVFLGAAIGLERGFHLGVDLFVNLLPPRFQIGLDVLTSVLIAIFAAAVIYASFPVISMNLLQRSPALGVQMAWIYLAIPISMVLIGLISISRVLETLRGRAEKEN